MRDPLPVPTGATAPVSRVAYAAAHVVADPLADRSAGAPAALDWDATLAFRAHLWSLGLGVADAMDTAQRGMGLDWASTRELIRRSGADARSVGGRLACGAGTDQLDFPSVDDGASTRARNERGAQRLRRPRRENGFPSVDDVLHAYEEQVAVVTDAGATVVLMASRALAAAARGPDDYHKVYDAVLGGLRAPAILHWLGPMFDPALAGYWGSTDLDAATDVVVELIESHADVVDGIKISLLDADREIALRRRLPAGVRCYTGDDFDYPALIAGDAAGHSDALLGIFDPIATAAASALRALDSGDRTAYDGILAPTVPLARKCFEAPTYHYKTGIVFLAWLAGHQDHFTMIGAAQSARSVPHLVDLFRLADAAGLLPDPDLAAERMRRLLVVSAGFDG
ncbi:MAG: dihydrodipicolinate synthase family protein [Mycobacteriales bacterium]